MGKTRTEPVGDGVWLLTLTDPSRRNALDEAMGAELVAAAAAVAAEPDARALVVTGEGEAFCAGADVPALFGDPGGPIEQTRRRLQDYYRGFLAIHELALPTVAAVNGPAIGAGLNLAMACDLRVAGPRAQFGATFTRIGLHPGGGCTWFLVQAMGSSRALRTLLLGDTLSAEQAVTWGLADGPEEQPVEAALELARRIAQVEPELARQVKRTVRLAVESQDLGAVQEYESWAQAASTNSPVLRRWVERFRKS